MRELPAILVLYNLSDTAPVEWNIRTFGTESTESVLDEVKVVTDALDRVGAPYRVAGVKQLSDIPVVLASAREPVIFNLVEGLIGDPQDASQVPAICSAFGKMSTGCNSICLTIALDKWRAKAVLRAAGVPVPGGTIVPVGESLVTSSLGKGPFIIKPAQSDASEGIGSSSVFENAIPAMEEAVKAIHREFKQPALVEQYFGDREFNISIIEDGDEIRIMPVAEIDFSAFEPGRPKIIDYAAKWLAGTFEYKNTSRIIPAKISDEVADKIRAVALKSWYALGCEDFVRVDMRMDGKGEVSVLEVNPNPDISLDAGFAAALAAGSVSQDDFVTMVVRNAMDRLDRRRIPACPEDGHSAVFESCIIRRTIKEDRDRIAEFLNTAGYFKPDEITIALEVLDDTLAKGIGGYYQSFSAEAAGKVAGWICFGPTPCTVGTYDIYWIVVGSQSQRKGIGSTLLRHAETVIAGNGGRLAVVETSGRILCESIRGFYLAAGYSEQARVADFYSCGDDKILFTKRLGHY